MKVKFQKDYVGIFLKNPHGDKTLLVYCSKSINNIYNNQGGNIMNNYVCSICGKKHVKLWRPYEDTTPLVCATCAEKRQSPREYDECVWKKRSPDHYIGIPTGKKICLKKWKVNKKGKIPSYHGLEPKKLPPTKTDQLIINLNDVSEAYSSGETTMIPAIPDENGDFLGYTCVPKKLRVWWEKLPTR